MTVLNENSFLQEKEYRNVTASGPLHTRLIYFDLMQIVPTTPTATDATAA